MKNRPLLTVTLSLLLIGCNRAATDPEAESTSAGHEAPPTGASTDVQRGMTAESLDAPSPAKQIDPAAEAEREARSAELMAKVPENLPLPEKALVDTLLDNEQQSFIMAVVPEAKSQEAVIAFYKERLPQLGWEVGEQQPLVTGDPSIPFENDDRAGLVKVYSVEGRPGFAVQIHTRAK